MSESFGESGQGESQESSSSAGESGNVGESTAEITGGEATGYNPNWNEAFEAIPIPEYHEKLKPVFDKWDKAANQRYEQVQQEYAPYKILSENKVDIADIRQAFELRNQLSQSPEVIFNRLAQHLGVDLSKLNGGDESQGQSEYPDEDEDPRIAELAKQTDGIRQYLANQAKIEEDQRNETARVEQETTWFNETKSGLDSIEAKYGPQDRNRIVQFAIWEAQKDGSEVDLNKGFQALQEFKSSAIQGSANAQAPTVFSGNGSLVSGRVDTSKMNEAEFQKYAVERIRAKNGGK